MLGFRNQNEMPQIYSLADVVVLPSESETWGMIVNEAMSCGIPAVVSDKVGCAPDLIEPGVTGYQFLVRDVFALAEALERVYLFMRSGTKLEWSIRRKMAQYSIRNTCDGIIRSIAAVSIL